MEGKGGGTNHKAGIGLSKVYAGRVEVCPLIESRDDNTSTQDDTSL